MTALETVLTVAVVVLAVVVLAGFAVVLRVLRQFGVGNAADPAKARPRRSVAAGPVRAGDRPRGQGDSSEPARAKRADTRADASRAETGQPSRAEAGQPGREAKESREGRESQAGRTETSRADAARTAASRTEGRTDASRDPGKVEAVDAGRRTGAPAGRSVDATLARIDAAAADLARSDAAVALARSDAAAAEAEATAAKVSAAAAKAEAAAAKAETAAARGEARRILDSARVEADGILDRAHRQSDHDAEQARAAARRAGEREVATLTAVAKEQTADAERRQQRLDDRERLLSGEAERLAERDRRLVAAEADLGERESALSTLQTELAAAAETQRRKLERIAGLTADAARTELIELIETQAKRDAAILVRDIEADARATGETRARQVVVEAIQRVASEQTAESVVSVLHLPTDEMKGRIIGREGRNIRAFESVTGVNLIIDDTPEAVLLSCFDPVRREVGRLTLEKLVLDGRIHPHRIEEVFEAAKGEVERLCLRAAEDALVEVGITDIHPELLTLLGRLRYRTSYGQNVLKHLVETAHVAGIMAAELRLDIPTIKRCAFLHDIGKALTHEVEGSHALIGADVARKYGESDEVVHAIEAHHNEVAPQTVEAVLTQASDACSGGRPGARRESLEAYVKRLERIEEIAVGKPGVEKVFAMQAGREIRVMVRPDDVDDIGAAILARDVAKQIEEELTYPGQIRVTVVRESRATELAR